MQGIPRICLALARAAAVAIFLVSAALAQVTTGLIAAPPIGADERFYPHYTVTPIGDGAKVLMTLDNGGQTLNIVVEPVTPKDGGPAVQWVLYNNGGGALYTKKQITLPGPNGGDGTLVEGISVTRLSAASPSPTASALPSVAGHQSSSTYTTPSHKAANFKMPLRMERRGPGLGTPWIWLLWDGKNEIRVDPVSTGFKGAWDINHLKFLANVQTQGSPAPRYFYFQRNGDDSITVYGDDDIDKLKAIEKGKLR